MPAGERERERERKRKRERDGRDEWCGRREGVPG